MPSEQAIVRFEGVVPTERFSRILLPDGAPVLQAVTVVCEIKDRTARAQEMAQRLTNQTSAKTVGDLRRLTDFDWVRLHLPAMFKVLLKYLVRSSVSPPVSNSSGGASSGATSAAGAQNSSLSGLVVDPQALAESALGKVLVAADPNLFRYAGIQARGPQPHDKASKAELLNSDPFVQALAVDFNYGQPFDFTLFQKPIKQLQELGYDKFEALEALLITGNTGHIPALEILFCPHEVRAKRRLKAVQRFNRNLGSTSRQQSFLDGPAGAGATAAAASNNNSEADQEHALGKLSQQNFVMSPSASAAGPPGHASAAGIPAEAGCGSAGGSENQAAVVQKMYQELTQLRRKLNKAGGGGGDDEPRVDMAEHDLRKQAYREFLRGLVAGESVTAQMQEQLKLQKERLRITDDEHVALLKEVGLSPAEFDALKQSDKFDLDCVVCMDKPKSHVIFNCAHLCLCDDCAEDYRKRKAASCPLCEKKVTKVQKIFL